METSSYFCLILLFLYFSTKFLLKKSRRHPPIPLSLPIIGHLYLIKKPLYRSLAKIANKYGLILLLNFGSRRVLVVSSPAAAEECFTKNDVAFANRPMMLAGKYLGYNYTTLTWASYGPHWRNIRRIFVTEILSTNRTQKLSSVRSDEVRLLIQRLFKGSCNAQYHVVDMKSAFFELTLNIVMKMITGKRYHGDNLDELEEIKKFRDMVVETFELSGSTNMGDFMPVLKWFGLDGLEKRLLALKEKRDGLVKILIEDHRRKRINSDTEQTSKTLLDVLLALQKSEPGYYTDEIIGGIILVMLSAGTDTSSGTMEWALTLLLNNSECLKKARSEIDNKIGESRLFQDSDLAELPYLNAIINETLRMKPAAPIIPAHESSEECDVGGFRVPRGTMLLVNAWAIQNDPKIWENPTKFNPERFLNIAGEKDGLKYLPFGLGRRECPGESLAMRVVGLTLGSIIHCFEWERVDEKMIDMSEGGGMTISKAQPLLAKCIPRQNMVSLFSQL